MEHAFFWEIEKLEDSEDIWVHLCEVDLEAESSLKDVDGCTLWLDYRANKELCVY